MPGRLLLFILTACAASVAWTGEAPPRALIFGVFHFANPGFDTVKTNQIDVTTPGNQAYLAALAERLSQFEPTAILVEVTPDREDTLNDHYRAYLGGTFDLTVNEVHQLAFRTAKASNLKRLHGFDDREVGWNPDALFEHLESSEPELSAEVDRTIDQITRDIQQAHATLTLRELLVMTNDPDWDRRNKDAYLLTNVAGAGSSFLGADATARWWHRNFRMYANVQKHAQPGARLLVIAGQGHTAILRDLLEIDQRIASEDPLPYLQAGLDDQ